MLLAVDIGNSNVTLGVYDNEQRSVCTARLATAERRTADQYALEIKSILELKGCQLDCIDGAVIGSVVPVIGHSIRQAIKLLFGIEPLVLGPGVKTGLNIKLDDPAQLGADLVAGAIGAMLYFAPPCIIIDMGTATTLSVIDRNGAFLGGIIAAGMELTRDILTQRTAQLPSVKIEAPESVIGKSTLSSMRSGLVLGTASMLDGLIDRITDELGYDCRVIATGGLSSLVIPYCRHEIKLCEPLVLDGLCAIYNKNKA